MQGSMMTIPLSIPAILRHAALYHGSTEIVSRAHDGGIHRYDYARAWVRTQKLAHALTKLGLGEGDRVGTIAWNGHRHLEVYYAVAGAGMVCHTINPRLFPEQIAFIINHAADKVLFVDPGFVPLLEGIADRLEPVRRIVVMADAEHMPVSSKLPELLCYETLIQSEPD